MLVTSAHTTRRHIPEHSNIYIHNRESLKGVHKFHKFHKFHIFR